ncbi:hypothetical protein CPC16_003695 [Podila verticillata]|nr:hypothetical protein BGZ52_002888 [Haplosporangium bisporale]KAF9370456.1 hypothetical protein CPC16_003695 [Podila verticillata]
MAAHFRFHALHIPEITGIIVSFLTWKDLLVCRGVSHEWRSLFSPHLHLSAIYWKQNPDDRVQLVQRLETLGPFVDSLRVVYPFAQELETISRTCTNLTHIGFFFSFRDTPAVHVGALQQFLTTMQTLESIDVFSHNDDARTAILYCLATYPSSKPSEMSSPLLTSSSPDLSHSPSSLNSTNTTTVSASTPSPQHVPTTGVLKKLKIEHGGYSMKVALLRWDHVEAVLTRNQSITHLHLQEAIVKTNAELLANPEDEDLDWTEDVATRVFGSLPIKRRFNRFLNRLSSLSFRRRSVSGLTASTSTTALVAPAPSSLSIQDEGSSSSVLPDPPTTPLFSTVLPYVIFGRIKSIVLHRITMSKELYCSLLSRCPLLTTLEVTGTGSVFNSRSDAAASWWDWLEHCRLLESVLIDQHLSMDIRQVWARAPTCLRSFQMNDIDWVMKPMDLSQTCGNSGSGGSGFVGSIGTIGMTAGSTLTRLHLETSQHIGEPVIHFIMQHCWSLQSLCLAVKTYDAQNFSKFYGEYPGWACGDTLRTLEIKALHESYGDVLSLWTVQKFLKRMEDLKVLEEVTLPLPFMGDIYRATAADHTLLNPPLPSVQKLILKGYRENQLWSDNIRLIVQWMPSLQVLWTPYRVFDRDRLAAIKET